MVEGLVNVVSPGNPISGCEGEANETIESLAISGAEAIQSIIADRKSLRARLNAQQRDLVAVNAINEELRRRITLIRHHYLELGKKAIALIEQLDQATREAILDHNQTASVASDEDPSLLALAQRFKPNNGTPKPSNDKDPTFVNGEPAISLIRPSTPVPS